MYQHSGHRYLIWRFILLSLAYLSLSACTSSVDIAIPSAATIQATEFDTTPTESPSDLPTVTPTTTRLSEATAIAPPPTRSDILEPTASSFVTVAPPLVAIADLLNTSRDLQGLDAFITSEFMLRPLPYSSQLLPRAQAVPNLMAYLGSAPQIVITEIIPDGIKTADWVQDAADFIVYSTGWGIHGTVTGLMLFTRQEGEILWSGLILSPDDFAPVPDLTTVLPPRYLTFQLEHEIFVVSNEGITMIFQGEKEDTYAYLVNPTNDYVLETQHNPETPYRLEQLTLVDLTTSSHRPLEMPYLVAQYGLGWLDESTVGMGIWLDEEDALGQTPGRPLVMDVISGEWSLLADYHVTISQVGDGRMVYTSNDEIFIWRETGETTYPMMDGGLPTLSHSERQWILTTSSQFALADLEGEIELLSYRAFHPQGRFLAQVAWSPDDNWVALRPPPTDLESDGVWLYKVSTEEMIYLGTGTINPLWQDSQIILFNATIAGELELQAYNVVTAERVKVDAPPGSIPLHFASAGE